MKAKIELPFKWIVNTTTITPHVSVAKRDIKAFKKFCVESDNEALIMASISKWKYMLWHAQRGLALLSGGEHSCPLCRCYVIRLDCKKCPVYTFSGAAFCASTPISDYESTLYSSSNIDSAISVIKDVIAFGNKVLESHRESREEAQP